MITEYIIGCKAALEILIRRLEKNKKREKIALNFVTGPFEDLWNLIFKVSEISDIEIIKDIYAYGWVFGVMGKDKPHGFPKLRKISLTAMGGSPDLFGCLKSLYLCPALETVALEAPCLDFIDLDKFFEEIRRWAENNNNLTTFKFTNAYFEKQIKYKPYSLYFQEFQKLLEKNKTPSIEHLVQLHKDLEDKKVHFKEMSELLQKIPKNSQLIMAEKLFFDATDLLISKKQNADAGYYYKALVIQLEKPEEAYKLLTNIPADSNLYQKANVLLAHMLMDNKVYCRVFYPQYLKRQELTKDEFEKLMAEKKKAVIKHLMLAKVEEDDKLLLNKFLTDYVYQKDSLANTPFDKMPVEPLPALFFLIDMLRENQSAIKTNEPPKQNVLLFSDTQQKSNKKNEPPKQNGPILSDKQTPTKDLRRRNSR